VDLKALAVEQEVAQVSRAVKSGNLSAGGSAPAMAMVTRKTCVAKSLEAKQKQGRLAGGHGAARSTLAPIAV
jgi:hypothetical protein